MFVPGHTGMVGRALLRRLERENIRLVEPRTRIDYRRQEDVESWMAAERPQVLFLVAARVGGIFANDNAPGEFIYDNLMIQSNVVETSRLLGVEKLMLLGSSCIYPRLAPQPIPESALLTGPLEPTNQWYAVAKIAGVKLGQAYRRQYGCDFISAMPTNLYGPGDNYDLQASHVLPALIRKAHEAKVRGDREFVVWGTGTPRREFLHVDDCADALVHVMKVYSSPEHINVGSGVDLTILELAGLVSDVVGFKGEIVHDLAKPDGTPRKLMSGDRLKQLGWRPRIALRDGIADAYRAFLVEGAASIAAAPLP